jgi:hypothetical protein
MLKTAIERKYVLTETLYRSRNNRLILLSLSDDDWKIVETSIHVLQPFKELTLYVSKDSFSIANVIPLYNYATHTLAASRSLFAEDDDLHIAISAAYDKLIHYYDHITPIA